MLHKSISTTSHFGNSILDGLASVRIQLQLASDWQLAQYAQSLIDQGSDRSPAILERAGDHGGVSVVIRMQAVLDRHDQYGVGEHLWNVTPDGRYNLVEGGNV